MSKGGLLLRFVDVVLILLFGFISISEVSEQSRIKLPISSETPPSYPDKETVIFIGITQNGLFLVENEQKIITNIQDLKRYILRKKRFYGARGIAIRIRYRANWNTPVRHTIEAAALCDALDIPKGIDVRLKTAF